MTIPKERMLQLRGDDLRDRDGDKIGTIEEIYVDADTGAPEWALVSTGLLGSKRTFVPLRDATGTLRVPFDKATVKAAPQVDPNGHLSRRDEARLYRHYGMEHSGSGSDNGLAAGRYGSGRVRLSKQDDGVAR